MCIPLPAIWSMTFFLSLHAQTMQVIPPLMCSLVDPVLKPKETQLDRIQPHYAVPAQLTVPELVVEVSCMLVIAIILLENIISSMVFAILMLLASAELQDRVTTRDPLVCARPRFTVFQMFQWLHIQPHSSVNIKNQITQPGSLEQGAMCAGVELGYLPYILAFNIHFTVL